MKRVKFSLSIITLACLSLNAFSQTNDPTIVTIGGKDIPKSEFVNIYSKNSPKNSAEKKSVDEYVQLFVNYKLKVREAEELGLDTVPAFVKELNGYRKTLAQPYLTDNEVTEQLMKEAYDRMKMVVRASHILIRVDQNALPKDTLKAYQKAIDVRNKIVKGEKFEKAAVEFSEDPSAKENKGDLGYFSAMQMVYPFENAAYQTKVGEISMPVRTRFGYHIVKVIDRKSAQGQITVAHILVSSPQGSSVVDSTNAQIKITELYGKLVAGENFAELAKQFSDDKTSAVKGGELPAFNEGRMVMEFENAAYALANDGDYTKPFYTAYGFHIVKRISKKSVPSYDEVKNELKNKIAKDSRSQRVKQSKVEKLKKEYKFKDNTKLRDEFVKVLDSTFFEGKWNYEKAKALYKPIFNLEGKTYTQQDFAQFIEMQQTNRAKTDYQVVLNQMYKDFIEKSILEFEESRLEIKYPEFKALMQEYKDGILLFDLTDKKVWSKAVKDSAGLVKFYDANKTKYMWEDRVQANIYTCANEKVAKETRKQLEQKKKKGFSDADVLKVINKDSQLNLKIDSGKFLKGENALVDQTNWVVGLSANMPKDNQVVIVEVVNKIAAEPKTLNEVRGLITSDYQTELEKNWLQELKAKYPVAIKQEVLQSLK
ncbi:MAG: peptidylprolyl isomerase [Bacteroidota bacterium]